MTEYTEDRVEDAGKRLDARVREVLSRISALEKKVDKLETADAVLRADITVLRRELIYRDHRMDVLEDHVKTLEDEAHGAAS